MSLKRSTFKVGEGKQRPSVSGSNPQDVNHENIVIEVKSEPSDRSEGQHPEYMVDVKKYRSSAGSGVSPAHASA